MNYVVYVHKPNEVKYCYGPFLTFNHAALWASERLEGFDWHVAQYVDITFSS